MAASVLAASKADVNENFIKACRFQSFPSVDCCKFYTYRFTCVFNRDGDLALFNSLLGSADVNHVSESLHGIKLVLPWLLLLGTFSDYVLLAGTLHWVLPSCSTTKK